MYYTKHNFKNSQLSYCEELYDLQSHSKTTYFLTITCIHMTREVVRYTPDQIAQAQKNRCVILDFANTNYVVRNWNAKW